MDASLVLHAIARALVLPPGGLILLGVAGLALLGRRPRLGRTLIASSLALLLLLSLAPFENALTRAVECCRQVDPKAVPPADVIVVLGGGITSGPAGAVVAPDTLERLAYAAGLSRLTGLPLLLSGGAVESEYPESRVMAQTLKDEFGLEARWLETRSRTTAENATECAALLTSLGLRRVLLVTSAVHMRRARAEFRRAGIEPLPAPAGSAGGRRASGLAWFPSMQALRRSHLALYEVAGELVAILSGRR
jgi:uncharacterized SAM-binding protein YcdF (DUF218 family)